MTTFDFITELFCRVDDAMKEVRKHSQSRLYPSEIVTLGLLWALKGGSERAFYRWVAANFLPLFPQLPERTRLFELFAAHYDWTDRFLASPTVLGVADSYGVELIHPRREGRSEAQIGKKGISNQRWIVGGKLAVILNQWGEVVAWDSNTANVYDAVFHPMIEPFKERMLVLADVHFHSKGGDPSNLKICRRNTWNCRMVVETFFSMIHRVCHAKKAAHRVWKHFHARLAFLVALYNLLINGNGLVPNEQGFIPLSIAQFSL
jgi:hypothetical protein